METPRFQPGISYIECWKLSLQMSLKLFRNNGETVTDGRQIGKRKYVYKT